MKVEIEIKKRDLRSICCAAIRNYYREVNLILEHETYPWQPDTCDEDITDNIYAIRTACDAIANLCNLIKELDAVEPNDARGVIRFDDRKED